MAVFFMGSHLSSNSPLIRLAYRGRSMRGVFKDGDCLWVCAVPFASLQTGDVVAFYSGGKAIAHRIVGIEAGGFVTQGDSCSLPDPKILSPCNLIGKIKERERTGKRSPVMAGIQGRLQGAFLRTANRLLRFIVLALKTPYRLTRTSRLVPLLWRPQILTVRFSGGEDNLTKFIHRGKTVACWVPHKCRWTCRKPYDLILPPPNV